MAVGDIMKEQNLIVEKMTVKTNEDIELGEIVVNDGNGLIAATSSHLGPFFVALEVHDYSEVSDHDIKVGVVGLFDVQAVPAAATVVGRYVEMSTTAGAVTPWDYSSPGAEYERVGIAMEVAATTVTSCKVLLGHNG
jgi:hypothetical protein